MGRLGFDKFFAHMDCCGVILCPYARVQVTALLACKHHSNVYSLLYKKNCSACLSNICHLLCRECSSTEPEFAYKTVD